MISQTYQAYKIVRAIKGRKNEANAARLEMIWEAHLRWPDLDYASCAHKVDSFLLSIPVDHVPDPRDIEADADTWEAAPA